MFKKEAPEVVTFGSFWGYDRMVGALANLGYPVSDQTVGNILRRPGIAHCAGREPNDHLEGLHSPAHGRSRRHRLLQRRRADLTRTGDVLRCFRSASGSLEQRYKTNWTF